MPPTPPPLSAPEIGIYSAADRVVHAAEDVSMRKINQQLIADRLKISRATVSRCFTNHPGINPVTRAKVFALAARMGYSHLEKREPAKHQRSVKRLAFGVLVCVDLPNFEHTDYGNPGQEILNGLSEFARVQDVRLDLHFVRPQDLHLNDPSYARILNNRRRIWSGIVLVYPFPLSVVDELMAKYPIVSLVDQYGTRPLDCVDVDHHRGINRLVDRLHQAGHRRIGFFTWRYPVEASWSLRRYSAFIERMTALGLAVDPNDVINTGPRGAVSGEEAHALAAERTRDGVTAWICAADHQAYELITYLAASGIKVPKDVSIVGFDGIAQPKDSPLLNTVQIPYHQIGLTGGKRLLDLIHKRYDYAQHILLDCELREGATLAAPRAARSR